MIKKYLVILIIACVFISCDKNNVTNNDTAGEDNAATVLNTDSSISEPVEKTWEDVISEFNLSIDDSSVSDLNSAGFSLYNQGEYSDAILLFTRSIKLDNNFAYGHYNIACMMSLLYGQGEDINLSDLYYHLKQSIELDSALLEKARKDSDFNSIKGRERFQDLISTDKVQYYVVTDNALDLEADGRLEEAFILVNTDTGMDNKGECELVESALKGLFSGNENTGYNNYLNESELIVNEVNLNGNALNIELSGNLMQIGMAVDLYIEMQIRMTIEHYTDKQYIIFINSSEIDWRKYYGAPSDEELNW